MTIASTAIQWLVSPFVTVFHIILFLLVTPLLLFFDLLLFALYEFPRSLTEGLINLLPSQVSFSTFVEVFKLGYYVIFVATLIGAIVGFTNFLLFSLVRQVVTFTEFSIDIPLFNTNLIIGGDKPTEVRKSTKVPPIIIPVKNPPVNVSDTSKPATPILNEETVTTVSESLFSDDKNQSTMNTDIKTMVSKTIDDKD